MSRGSFGRRWARIIRPDARAEVDEELQFHLEERVRENMARGMDADSARAAAQARMGDLKPVRDDCVALLEGERRQEQRREWLTLSWLDFKLGFRMLVRYPALTVVSVLAIAFAIWIGTGTFEFAKQVLFPTLPLPAGERIVGIENHDVSTSRANRQLLHDLVTWRSELRSVEDLGAFRVVQRNLVIPGGAGAGGGAGEPVHVAEMSAAGFRVARVPPMLGRPLIAADEEPGAPLVAVIGYDVWQSRFGGDPDVLERSIVLGGRQARVVGVMPEGFGFPISENLWTPLRLDPLEHARGEGPSLRVFGRLASGYDLERARAELRALGQRMSAEHPETHEHLRPRIDPHAKSVLGLSGFMVAAGISSFNIFAVLLLTLICGNVALLLFARAATRESELTMRSALGASRGRIVTQLFTEALVLGLIGALIGITAAGAGLGWGLRILEDAILDGQRLPFWFRPELTPSTIGYALLLTLVVAIITGVVPGLKVTGRNVGSRLKQASAGSGGFQFGGIWTPVIVLQIAVMVAFPIGAFMTKADEQAATTFESAAALDRYLYARVEMDRDTPGADTSAAVFHARYASRLNALEERLQEQPGVRAVTFAERLPLTYHPHRRVEIEGGGATLTEREARVYGDAAAIGYRVSSAAVALDYPQGMGVEIVKGRDFHSGDLESDARAVLVNESFVRRILGGRNPIGRRIRYMFYEERRGEPYVVEEQPWYEIVGVVPDLAMAPHRDTKSAGIYHPTTAAATYPLYLAVRASGDPAALAPVMRATATAVDPALRLYGVMPLVDLLDVELEFYKFWFRITLMISVVAIVLSLAGIYAVLAYTVSRRTREIGIRVALGGSARRVILAIFRRPLAQVAGGVLLGAVLIQTVVTLAEASLRARSVAVVAAYALFMFGVCMLACIVPARRALGVQPLEALREER
ncbi:MAG: ABC transporter permease [Longimicrobiales bacterium]